MQSITQQFTDWLRTKPADEAYDFCDAKNCAFAQFEKAMGTFTGGRHDPAVALPGEPTLPKEVVDALNPRAGAFTFGALLERMEARS